MDDAMMIDSERLPIFEEFLPAACKWSLPLLVTSLREQTNRIVANWALRVATLPAFRAMPNLGLEEVQLRIPQILESAFAAIATSDPTMDPGPIERASELAAAHGKSRLHDDLGIGDLLSEFHALRREVSAALWRVVEPADHPLNDIREVDARLNETFDAIVIAAAEAWSDARLHGKMAS